LPPAANGYSQVRIAPYACTAEQLVFTSARGETDIRLVVTPLLTGGFKIITDEKDGFDLTGRLDYALQQMVSDFN
jgi:hypothetical protein